LAEHWKKANIKLGKVCWFIIPIMRRLFEVLKMILDYVRGML